MDCKTVRILWSVVTRSHGFFNDKSATSEKMERGRETGEWNHGRTNAFGTSPLTSFALSVIRLYLRKLPK